MHNKYNHNTIILIDGSIDVDINIIPIEFKTIFESKNINTTKEMIEILLEILVEKKIIFDDIILYNAFNFMKKIINSYDIIKYLYKIHTGDKILYEYNNINDNITYNLKHICENHNKKHYIINTKDCILLLLE